MSLVFSRNLNNTGNFWIFSRNPGRNGHPKFPKLVGAPTSFGKFGFFWKFWMVLDVGLQGSAFRTIVGWPSTQKARKSALQLRSLLYLECLYCGVISKSKMSKISKNYNASEGPKKCWKCWMSMWFFGFSADIPKAHGNFWMFSRNPKKHIYNQKNPNRFDAPTSFGSVGNFGKFWCGQNKISLIFNKPLMSLCTVI